MTSFGQYLIWTDWTTRTIQQYNRVTFELMPSIRQLKGRNGAFYGIKIVQSLPEIGRNRVLIIQFKDTAVTFTLQHCCYTMPRCCYTFLHCCYTLLHSATLLLHSATLLLHSATLLLHSATLLLHSATLLLHSVTLLLHSATLLLHSATLLLHFATLLLHCCYILGILLRYKLHDKFHP